MKTKNKHEDAGIDSRQDPTMCALCKGTKDIEFILVANKFLCPDCFAELDKKLQD